jgi:hypothetical protein
VLDRTDSVINRQAGRGWQLRQALVATGQRGGLSTFSRRIAHLKEIDE